MDYDKLKTDLDHRQKVLQSAYDQIAAELLKVKALLSAIDTTATTPDAVLNEVVVNSNQGG